MTGKVFSWNDRVADHNPRPMPHATYFFRKSFDDCTAKSLKSVLLRITKSKEAKCGVTYSPEVQQLIDESQSDCVTDPFLHAIFGAEPIDRRAVLNYYEKDAEYNKGKGMAFVDLCVILGEMERAVKFAERTGREYEVLKILQQSGGKLQSEVLRNQAIQLWMENTQTKDSKEAARLTSIIYRAAESTSDEHAMRPLAELWGEHFYWDAMCLVSLIFPSSGHYDFMKENVIHCFLDPQSKAMAGILTSVLAINDTTEMKETAYEDYVLQHIDPLLAYRLVKIDILRNETAPSAELEKLAIRSKCSDAIRRVLLACLTTKSPCIAKAVAADVFAYIKTLDGGLLADYFPSAERKLFETCISMALDIATAIRRIDDNSTAPGMLNNIFAEWKEKFPKIWSDKWGRSSLVQIFNGLRSTHLPALEKICPNSNHLNVAKLALRLCWLFASDDFDINQNVKHGMTMLALDSGFDNKDANKIVFAFTKGLTSESRKDSITPVQHLTGDELISNIKEAGIKTPPLPKDMEPVITPDAHMDIETTPTSRRRLAASESTVAEEEADEQKDTIGADEEHHEKESAAAENAMPDEEEHAAGEETTPAVCVVSEDTVVQQEMTDDRCMETKWEAPTAAEGLHHPDDKPCEDEKTMEIELSTQSQVSVADDVEESPVKKEEIVCQEGDFMAKNTDWKAVPHEVPAVDSSVDKTNTTADEEPAAVAVPEAYKDETTAQEVPDVQTVPEETGEPASVKEEGSAAPEALAVAQPVKEIPVEVPVAAQPVATDSVEHPVCVDTTASVSSRPTTVDRSKYSDDGWQAQSSPSRASSAELVPAGPSPSFTSLKMYHEQTRQFALQSTSNDVVLPNDSHVVSSDTALDNMLNSPMTSAGGDTNVTPKTDSVTSVLVSDKGPNVSVSSATSATSFSAPAFQNSFNTDGFQQKQFSTGGFTGGFQDPSAGSFGAFGTDMGSGSGGFGKPGPSTGSHSGSFRRSDSSHFGDRRHPQDGGRPHGGGNRGNYQGGGNFGHNSYGGQSGYGAGGRGSYRNGRGDGGGRGRGGNFGGGYNNH